MATAESVKNKLQGLLDKANETTGRADADLSSAVEALQERYLTEEAEDAWTEGGRSGIYKTLPNNRYSNHRITQVGRRAFNYVIDITEIDLPNVVRICHSGLALLNYMTGPADLDLVFPALEVIEQLGFSESKIRSIDLPRITEIQKNAFQYTSDLRALIIRNTEKLCILGGTGTTLPVSYGAMYIYVPKKFLSDEDSTMDYRQATNWSSYADWFRALEDYTVDGTTTGAFDFEKIGSE